VLDKLMMSARLGQLCPDAYGHVSGRIEAVQPVPRRRRAVIRARDE
jgi:hypothetical protein